MNNDSSKTNYLAKAKKRNRKAAGVLEIIGDGAFQKAINRNRKNAGLKMLKPNEFKSNPQNEEE